MIKILIISEYSIDIFHLLHLYFMFANNVIVCVICVMKYRRDSNQTVCSLQGNNTALQSSSRHARVKPPLGILPSSAHFPLTFPRWNLCKHTCISANFQAAAGQRKLSSNGERSTAYISTHFLQARCLHDLNWEITHHQNFCSSSSTILL